MRVAYGSAAGPRSSSDHNAVPLVWRLGTVDSIGTNCPLAPLPYGCGIYPMAARVSLAPQPAASSVVGSASPSPPRVAANLLCFAQGMSSMTNSGDRTCASHRTPSAVACRVCACSPSPDLARSHRCQISQASPTTPPCAMTRYATPPVAALHHSSSIVGVPSCQRPPLPPRQAGRRGASGDVRGCLLLAHGPSARHRQRRPWLWPVAVVVAFASDR